MAQDDFIPKGNIERFKQQLKDARTEGERKILRELLVVERQRLAAAHKV